MTRAIGQHKPTYFNGKSYDPIVLQNWIREFEKLFTALDCPEELKFDQDAFYLSETADIWWTSAKEEMVERETEYGEIMMAPIMWGEFTKTLRIEFFPEHLSRAKRINFDDIKQGFMTVQEYYLKFQELSRLTVGDTLSESSKALKFEQNLDIDIREKLAGFELRTLTALYFRACIIERILDEKKKVTGKN
ncbi:hypothetical protein vseg_020916 [Gypsophila vaccaria]